MHEAMVEPVAASGCSGSFASEPLGQLQPVDDAAIENIHGHNATGRLDDFRRLA